MRKPPLAEAQTALGKQQNAGICPLRKVMAKNDFKYSGRPLFWIFGIHFGHVTHRVPNVLLCTKFHPNRMTFRWRRFNDVQDGGRCRERRINKSRAQTPPRPKCQPKVIQDSNPEFWINPDPDVCGIAPKMLWRNSRYFYLSPIRYRCIEKTIFKVPIRYDTDIIDISRYFRYIDPPLIQNAHCLVDVCFRVGELSCSQTERTRQTCHTGVHSPGWGGAPLGGGGATALCHTF